MWQVVVLFIRLSFGKPILSVVERNLVELAGAFLGVFNQNTQ